MDWLSDLGWKILHLAGAVSDGLFFVAVVLIVLAAVTLIWLLIGAKGNVSMGPDPTPRGYPATRQITIASAPDVPRGPAPGSSAHVWTTEPHPLPTFLEAVEETTAAVIDLTETVEFRTVDPLDDTAELEVMDPDTPLYLTIRRPAPLHLESFTREWTRERLERIKEGKP